jgi:hypothetical protein
MGISRQFLFAWASPWALCESKACWFLLTLGVLHRRPQCRQGAKSHSPSQHKHKHWPCYWRTFSAWGSPALSRQTKPNKDSVMIEQNWYPIAHCTQGIEITFRKQLACKGQSENLAKFRMATRIFQREHLN